jgi:sialate O-acetylesterase
MALTQDIGQVNDIHPKDKQEVGRRLALWALARTYGREKLVYSGPIFKAMTVDGNKLTLTFNHTGGGLQSRDLKDLTWFEVAAKDGNFVHARAKLGDLGETVTVWSEMVDEPTAVRFAWSQIAEPNLINAEGLPAAPFRASVKAKP